MGDTTSKMKSLVNLVTAFVNEHQRGMETFRLQAAGYSKSDINDAIEAKVLESRRGRTGGIYPYGQVPESVPVSTLKGEAMAVLRQLAEDGTFDADTVNDLLERYEAECKKRSDAKKKASDEDGDE